MFCDKYDGDDGCYGMRFPVEFELAVRCLYKEGKGGLADEHESR